MEAAVVTGPVTKPEPELDADDVVNNGADNEPLADDSEDDTLADEYPENPEPRPSGTDPAVGAGAARGRRRLQLSNAPLAVPSGQALTSAEASAVLAKHPAELVVAVAEVDAGKTTLFASMYEQLARGPLEGWAFDGSLSLLGFESRSFDASRDSGNLCEETNRTSRNTPRIALHLAVRAATGDRRHLLLGDVSGEHAGSLIDFGDPGDFRPLLRAATRALVLIDGARLASPADQNATLSRARVLIRALVEGGDVRAQVPLELVVTKWDQCGDAEGLSGELDRLLAFTQSRWEHAALHRTAARPHGEGVADLFATLLSTRPPRPAKQWAAPAPTRPLHLFAVHDGVASRFLASRARLEK